MADTTGPGSAAAVRVPLLDRIAFLMSIKEEGKAVSFDHIQEKVTRDVAFLGEEEPTEAQYKEALASLVEARLLSQDAKGFYRSPALDAYAGSFVGAMRNSLNKSYFLVYMAERYYPKVLDAMLPFLVNRPLSAVKVFSGKKDPIGDVEPIFVRYSKYKPLPVHLSVGDGSDLMKLVQDHCVDFSPYVHGFDGRPNVLLIDLDLGEDLAHSTEGVDAAKIATVSADRMLRERGGHPLIKFSGNRGFQVTCVLSPSERPLDFFILRDIVKRIQIILEETLESEASERLEALGLAKPFTTSTVAHKDERATKILLDWSSMKPEGDYRAPFSIHYKTGLASVPLLPEQVEGFAKEDANPLSLIQRPGDFAFVKDLRDTPVDCLTSLL